MKTLIVIGAGAVCDPILGHILFGDPDDTVSMTPDFDDVLRHFARERFDNWVNRPEHWSAIIETDETHRLDHEKTVIAYAEYVAPHPQHQAFSLALDTLQKAWHAWERANFLTTQPGSIAKLARRVRDRKAERFSASLAQATKLWNEIMEDADRE